MSPCTQQEAPLWVNKISLQAASLSPHRCTNKRCPTISSSSWVIGEPCASSASAATTHRCLVAFVRCQFRYSLWSKSPRSENIAAGVLRTVFPLGDPRYEWARGRFPPYSKAPVCSWSAGLPAQSAASWAQTPWRGTGRQARPRQTT